MGQDLTVLSLQNEPNFKCTYESADWSAAQFHDFMVVLKAEFTKKGVFTALPNLQIMAPEYQNVKEDLVLPILQDTATAGLLGIVGVHQYEFGKGNENSYVVPKLTNSLAAGKRVWMTEWSTAEWTKDESMANALIVAKILHEDFTTGQMSAFNYWWSWGKTESDGNGYLVLVDTAGAVTVPKRTWAIGQYSRFVRPGWHRVAATAKPVANVLVSAYKDPTENSVAIVAINTGAMEATLPLSVDTGQFETLTAYRTSAQEDLKNVGTVVGGPSIEVKLAPSSVTTYVGYVAY
jgi:O-glycosyl hydrolase